MRHFVYGFGAISRFHTRPVLFSLGLLLALAFAGNALGATAVPLGAAATFGALSSTAMTNAGSNTVVHGNIGSSTSIGAGVTHPGFGAYGAGSSQLANAQASLLTAYGAAAAATPDQPTITGANLAGKTLVPGVYNSTSSILISGPTPLTLDGGGDPNAVFIFQAASFLTVDPTSSVTLTGKAQACNVFWQVGSSAFLKNTDATFNGTILALTQITLTDAITVNGRVLAQNADVTFIHDTVNTPTCTGSPPPPVDTTPPACALTATLNGPPKQIQVTVQDSGSGLGSVQVTTSTNATTVVPPFASGTTGPVVVTATKINPSTGSSVALSVTDAAGNVMKCDPILSGLTGGPRAGPVSRTFKNLVSTESRVTIVNGKPGLRGFTLKVNGKTFAVPTLADGRQVVIDVSAAMRPGHRNTITISAIGKKVSDATIAISG